MNTIERATCISFSIEDRNIYVTKFDNCELKIILTPKFISIEIVYKSGEIINCHEKITNSCMEYELNKIILENLEKKYKNDLSVHSIDYYSDESKIRKIRFLPHFEFNDTIVPVKNLTVSFNV